MQNNNRKIAICYGTRPEYIKILPLLRILPKKNRQVFFIGQHKELLKKNFFDKKIIIKNLTKKKNHTTNRWLRLNLIISECIKRIDFLDCDSVLVQGDTASAFASSVAAFNNKKKIIYLESGLRSFDLKQPYPEEGYRQMISRISDINFCPTQLSKKNLLLENIRNKIYVVGNTCLDNLIKFKKNISYQNFILITLHRREKLFEIEKWFFEINKIAVKYPNLTFIFISHPNPEVNNKIGFLENVKIIKPMKHSKFIKLLSKCKFVITDSGGIQEEASFLNKKIIVCRKITERPEGILSGHLLICNKPKNLKLFVKKTLSNFIIKTKCPYGNGNSANKILNILKKNKFC